MSEAVICAPATSRSRVLLVSATISLAISAAILMMQFLARQAASYWSVSLVQRYCLAVTALCAGELLVTVVFLLIWKPRRAQFEEIGFFRAGNVWAWIVALTITAISVVNGVNLMRRFGMPVSNLWSMSASHLYAVLMVGTTAAFCEETIFRGFLMTEYARAGYGKVLQVVVPGIFFGLAHLAILQQGVAAGLSTIVPTAVMGMIWGVAYLLGRRSLIPCVVAHWLNDATALPWILYFFVTRGTHH
jgi:hypothetical protein